MGETDAANQAQQNTDLEKRIADLQAEVNQLRGVDGNVASITVGSQLKLPPFWRENPTLWFGQIEMSFAISKITGDYTKFRYVVLNLDQKTLPFVSDLIANPPADEKYEAVKKRIIDTFSESDEAKLRRLLGGIHISDEKPTHVLQKIKNLAGSQCNASVIRTLFLEHLPEQVRAHLVIGETADLSKLALQADKIVEIVRPTTPGICAVGNNKATDPMMTECKNALEKLTREVAALNRKVNGNDAQQRGRSRNRSASKSRQNGEDSSGFCFYHARFQEKAHNCRPPCTYKEKPAEN